MTQLVEIEELNVSVKISCNHQRHSFKSLRGKNEILKERKKVQRHRAFVTYIFGSLERYAMIH